LTLSPSLSLRLPRSHSVVRVLEINNTHCCIFIFVRERFSLLQMGKQLEKQTSHFFPSTQQPCEDPFLHSHIY
jgi:hypothetical protein